MEIIEKVILFTEDSTGCPLFCSSITLLDRRSSFLISDNFSDRPSIIRVDGMPKSGGSESLRRGDKVANEIHKFLILFMESRQTSFSPSSTLLYPFRARLFCEITGQVEACTLELREI